MLYSLMLVVAMAAILVGLKKWQSLPKDQRKGFAQRGLIWGGVIIVLALVLTGRAHWLMGVLAALIALASRAVQLAQYVPILKKLMGDFQAANGNGGSNNSSSATADMTRKEAADILGVDANASAEQVKEAHKKLMQKIHPDRGGTDALAQQINAARDTLLS